jgi:hypothetical protein
MATRCRAAIRLRTRDTPTHRTTPAWGAGRYRRWETRTAGEGEVGGCLAEGEGGAAGEATPLPALLTTVAASSTTELLSKYICGLVP